MSRATGSENLPRFAELDVVSLRSAIYDEASVLPVGTLGTIVHRYPGGEAFEVEFDQPHHVVVTLRASDLQPTE